MVDRRKDRSHHDLHYHSKHVKGTINHQLQKCAPLGLVSNLAEIYFAPRGERENNGGVNTPGAFLLFTSENARENTGGRYRSLTVMECGMKAVLLFYCLASGKKQTLTCIIDLD